MQERDIHPLAEGDTNGAVDGVRQNEARVVRWAASAGSTRASLPLPWITAIAPIWARITATATRDGDRDGPVFPRPTRWLIPNRCPLQKKMPLRAFSRLLKTCSF